MFLFSSPAPSSDPASAPGGENSIARAVRSAAAATGTSFDYLIKTAKRESNLNPEAKAPSSSATGLFQFIEQTWLGLVKKEGNNLGLGAHAEAIQQDSSGRYSVPEASARRQILELRKDPDVSARLAGKLTQQNRETLKESLGRDPNSGELYIAHFLGAHGASELINLAQNEPAQSAARAFPEAASANRSIFFDGKGRARTVREVYARLSAFHTGVDPSAEVQLAQAPTAEESGPQTRSPLAIAAIPRQATLTGPPRSANALHGLFRNGGDGPAATALRKTWTGFAESRINKDAPSFFPRENAVQVASLAQPVAGPDAVLSDVPTAPLAAFEALAPVEAPLPPIRPPGLGGAGGNSRAPLDLTLYGKSKR